MEEKATTEISWARRTIMMIVSWCITTLLESASECYGTKLSAEE